MLVLRLLSSLFLSLLRVSALQATSQVNTITTSHAHTGTVTFGDGTTAPLDPASNPSQSSKLSKPITNLSYKLENDWTITYNQFRHDQTTDSATANNLANIFQSKYVSEMHHMHLFPSSYLPGRLVSARGFGLNYEIQLTEDITYNTVSELILTFREMIAFFTYMPLPTCLLTLKDETGIYKGAGSFSKVSPDTINSDTALPEATTSSNPFDKAITHLSYPLSSAWTIHYKTFNYTTPTPPSTALIFAAELERVYRAMMQELHEHPDDQFPGQEVRANYAGLLFELKMRWEVEMTWSQVFRVVGTFREFGAFFGGKGVPACRVEVVDGSGVEQGSGRFGRETLLGGAVEDDDGRGGGREGTAASSGGSGVDVS